MNISGVLRDWYRTHKRDLPWRETADPYVIWLSEVILQQTRVEQGLPYFQRFTEKYPTVHALAKAPPEEVLKLWQGLGYYSRARNLQFAARQIVSEFGGRFPVTYDSLLTLKGVGEYTAAAIASFSTGERVPVVDGNVYRFLARYYGISQPINSTEGKKVFKELATSILPPKRYMATHNQAIMEFGSLQCRPSNPDCGSCPFADTCQAFRTGKVKAFPVKVRKGSVRNRYFNYLVLVFRNQVLIRKRNNSDIWKELYEFPLIETERELGPVQLKKLPGWKQYAGKVSIIESVSGPFIHKLSHQTIHARFLKLKVTAGSLPKRSDLIAVPVSTIHDYPVSRLMQTYIENEHHW